jgi:uncharacterized protein (TIGR02145 family)
MDDYVVVKLSPEFITITDGGETPMKVISAQPTDTSQPVYAIQIYENDSTYYYGLFDDVSKMEIALSTAKTYKFKVAAIKNGTGRGLKMDTNGGENNYYLPNKVSLGNKFIKGNLLKNIDLINSIKLNESDKDYSEVDAFYTTKTITIEKGSTNIDFLLLRMGFGMAINVDSLTSGDLLVFIGNDTIALNSQKTSAYTIRQFNAALCNFNTIHTNASGYADSILISVKWTVTNETTIESERKYLFKRNFEKTINIDLNVNFSDINLEDWISNVTDFDGNVYKTIKIGNQVWMAENLKVTKYRDGSVIQKVTDGTQWVNLNNGAYCFYNNDPIYKEVFGCLYNFHVISDNRGIAPIGWHIPSDEEWNELANYLGGENISGGKLKAEGLKFWQTPNLGATNESGFSALPSGSRDNSNSGLFYLNGKVQDYWSSTIFDSESSWRRSLGYDNSKLYRSLADKKCGFSIRCIKN